MRTVYDSVYGNYTTAFQDLESIVFAYFDVLNIWCS